jgi:hypothetical protein
MDDALRLFDQRLTAIEAGMHKISDLLLRMLGNATREEVYNVKKGAPRAGLSQFTFRQKCNKGFIKATKIEGGAGGQGEWRVTDEEIERYKAEGDRNPPVDNHGVS